MYTYSMALSAESVERHVKRHGPAASRSPECVLPQRRPESGQAEGVTTASLPECRYRDETFGSQIRELA